MSSKKDERVVIDFDHHAPELAEQVGELGVGPLLGEYREQCPVAWTEAQGGYWLVTGHPQIREISRDDYTFSSDHDPEGVRRGYEGVTIPPTYPVPLGFIEMDPPAHTAIRKKLTPFFTPKAVEGWRPVINDLVTAFIDRIIERGECEFVQDISSPVPAVLTMMLLGANTDHWRAWADANHHTTMYAPGSDGHAKATEEMMGVMQELSDLINERLDNPEDGASNLISFLCQTEIDGRRLTHDEILLHTVLLTAGGVDTTTASMTAAIKWLGEHPAERQRLKEGGPELMKTAIEEFLRFSAPVSGLARTAKCPYEIAGQKINEHDRILMMFSAANFDPSVFENPETVDLERSPNPHATFGLGAHRCIGQHFARAELESVLRAVLERMPDYVVGAEPSISPDVGVNQSWVDLPMTFTSANKMGSTFKPVE